MTSSSPSLRFQGFHIVGRMTMGMSSSHTNKRHQSKTLMVKSQSRKNLRKSLISNQLKWSKNLSK